MSFFLATTITTTYLSKHTNDVESCLWGVADNHWQVKRVRSDWGWSFVDERLETTGRGRGERLRHQQCWFSIYSWNNVIMRSGIRHPSGLMIQRTWSWGRKRNQTGPLRLTLRPFADGIIAWWRDYMILFDKLVENINFPCFWRKRHRPTDGPTDKPGYRDARTHLKTVLQSWARKLYKVTNYRFLQLGLSVPRSVGPSVGWWRFRQKQGKLLFSTI